LEHSSEAAVRGFAIFLSVAAGAAESLLAGAVVCARAGLANSKRDARAVAATREYVVFMEAPRVEEGRKSRCDAERLMNDVGTATLRGAIFLRNPR
jgi:hypothetical protein